MCGITGYFLSKPVPPQRMKRLLGRMTDCLIHRGPDDRGEYQDEWCGLGHRRLSIIDLSTGHQPMASQSNRFWIVYNGEVYNFRDIRKKLESCGYIFQTESDTEVLVQAFEAWGPMFVHHLRGMFAFAIWDTQERTGYLFRDPVGIKPLYYTLTGDGHLAFGSELKSLLLFPKIDDRLSPSGIDAYLTLEYIPAPASIFRSIHKLPPGSWLRYRQGHVYIHQYWEIPSYTIPSWDKDPERYEALLLERFDETVRYHLVSDVPLGAFLSGGVDSSSVVASMAQVCEEPVRSFSIGFEDATYNELPYARVVADLYRTDHTERVLDYDIIETCDELLLSLDEPIGDFSIFPTYLVSKTAREYVKVVLSGDGGDELFAGYEHYIAWKLDRWLRWIPFQLRRILGASIVRWSRPSAKKKGVLNRLRRFSTGWMHPDWLDHLRYMIFLSQQQKRTLYTDDFYALCEQENVYHLLEPYFERARQFDDPINAQLYLDFRTYLPDDILVKVDRMSMAVSLETRVPFLDGAFVSWVFQLPGKWKLHGFQTKWILKRAQSSRLPKSILYREKQGFSIPMKNWLRKELRSFLHDHLNETHVRQTGLFEWDPIHQWIQEHEQFIEDHAHRIWALLLFQVWYERMKEFRKLAHAENEKDGLEDTVRKALSL